MSKSIIYKKIVYLYVSVGKLFLMNEIFHIENHLKLTTSFELFYGLFIFEFPLCTTFDRKPIVLESSLLNQQLNATHILEKHLGSDLQ